MNWFYHARCTDGSGVFPYFRTAVTLSHGCFVWNVRPMKKITALRLQKRNAQRVNVYLDGEFAFGLSRIVAAWLRVGQELSDEKIAALLAEDARETAWQRALNFLSYRDRSLEEIRQNLKKHEVSDEIIAEILQRLQTQGFADDARFARLWVENRNQFRPRGRRLLAQELRRKGIKRDVIERVLENVPEEELALQAGRKFLRRYAGLPWQDFRRKMTAFLLRRGFDYEVVKPAVNRLWQETGSSEADNEKEEMDL